MIKSYVKRVLLLVVGLLCSIIMPAQDLPVLSPDKAVRSGVLPNGTSYYVVTNSTIKGVADLALVQKTGTENVTDSTYQTVVKTVARDALAELPRSGGRSVQEFFTLHGVTPGTYGFVKVTDNATEFRFSDVLLSKPEVLDSALLVVLDMIDRMSRSDDPFLNKLYSPADQAIIIAGDVDAASVAEKLKMISYMTPSVASTPRKEYVWEQRDSASYVNVPASNEGVASFAAVWNSARTPREYMNTVQPAIYELFLAELGMLAEEYVSEELRSRNLPVAGISCGHRTSLQSSGDEAFSVSLTVAEKDFPSAVEVVAGVMGRIDSGNADVRDLLRMKRICMDQARELAVASTTANSDYVDRCVAAFIYNGSLSTLQTKVDFLTGRVLADTTEFRLFNSISTALLDPERNLEISYSHPMVADSVRTIFTQSWSSSAGSSDPSEDDVTAYPYFAYAGPKIKIKSEKTDHMSKGVEWTFSNGFKVVYRRMPTGGRIHYALSLNGGYGSIDEIAKGEGGYISDYYMLSRISYMPAEEFLARLAADGISLDVHAGLTATIISGSADDNNVDHMMMAILSAVNTWEMDEDAVRYYESCEPLRHAMRKGTAAEMVAKVNEIMCPDYRYVSYKMLDRLSPDLAKKAEGFYNDIFRKTNDGVLILLGDLDPAALKKKITVHVPGFMVTDRAFRSPLVRYQPASGWSTYTVDGDRNSVDIALSVPLALTAENFMAAEVAALVLKKMLSEALIESGMYLDISHECRIYPNERINFHISLNEISPDGFARDVVHSGPIEALSIVRSVISGAGGIDVSNEDVEAFKTRMKAGMDVEMKSPFYWLNVISRRHIAGKDFTTDHQARIKSVNAAKVKEILSNLNEGTRVEYIVSRR